MSLSASYLLKEAGWPNSDAKSCRYRGPFGVSIGGIWGPVGLGVCMPSSGRICWRDVTFRSIDLKVVEKSLALCAQIFAIVSLAHI
jgi:hypothetical protein